MKIYSAEEFKQIWDQEIDSPHYPDVEIEDDKIWIDIINKYPDMEFIVVNYPVSPYVLSILAKSKDDDIRYRVATKRRILPETFELLSKDQYSWIRSKIACNQKCPLHILESLLKDKNKDVVESAKYHLERRKNKQP